MSAVKNRAMASAIPFCFEKKENNGSITSANVANAIVKLVAADALPALVGNLVMGNLVNRDYEPTGAGGRHGECADRAAAGGE